MKFVPDDIHRERQDEERPAVWYVVWLGEPHAEGSAVIGRSKRLRRHREHRFFPERGGAAPQDIVGWVKGAQWLLEEYRKSD
jgi:hypothetical protein